MQSDGNSCCGNVVLDQASIDEDNILVLFYSTFYIYIIYNFVSPMNYNVNTRLLENPDLALK